MWELKNKNCIQIENYINKHLMYIYSYISTYIYLYNNNKKMNMYLVFAYTQLL